MRAVTYIMSDDLEGAEAGLTHGNSSFSQGRPQISSILPQIRADRFYLEERWLMRMLVGI